MCTFIIRFEVIFFGIVTWALRFSLSRMSWRPSGSTHQSSSFFWVVLCNFQPVSITMCLITCLLMMSRYLPYFSPKWYSNEVDKSLCSAWSCVRWKVGRIWEDLGKDKVWLKHVGQIFRKLIFRNKIYIKHFLLTLHYYTFLIMLLLIYSKKFAFIFWDRVLLCGLDWYRICDTPVSAAECEDLRQLF